MKEIKIRNHIFKIWGIAAIFLETILFIFKVPYDSGGILSILILTEAFLGFPFWLPSEILFSLNKGHAIKGHTIVAIIMGFILLAAIDKLIVVIKKKRLTNQCT